MMMDMEERKRKADEEMVINTPIPLACRGTWRAVYAVAGGRSDMLRFAW